MLIIVLFFMKHPYMNGEQNFQYRKSKPPVESRRDVSECYPVNAFWNLNRSRGKTCLVNFGFFPIDISTPSSIPCIGHIEPRTGIPQTCSTRFRESLVDSFFPYGHGCSRPYLPDIAVGCPTFCNNDTVAQERALEGYSSDSVNGDIVFCHPS